MMIITKYEKHYKKTTVTIKHAKSTNRITLIKGANGSGKTTLLKSIARLNHYTGTIKTPTPAYYIEESAVFPEAMTVEAYLRALVSLNHIPFNKCQYLLDYFAMTPYIDQCFSTLSKGMKQKINLIQTLILPSNSYLLDEPLSGLDDHAIKKLIRLIQAAKTHFIIATHNVTPFLVLKPDVIAL